MELTNLDGANLKYFFTMLCCTCSCTFWPWFHFYIIIYIYQGSWSVALTIRRMLKMTRMELGPMDMCGLPRDRSGLLLSASLGQGQGTTAVELEASSAHLRASSCCSSSSWMHFSPDATQCLCLTVNTSSASLSCLTMMPLVSLPRTRIVWIFALLTLGSPMSRLFI